MAIVRFDDGRAFIEYALCTMREPLHPHEIDSDNGLPVSRSMASMDRAVNFILETWDWYTDEWNLAPIDRNFG